MLTLIFFQQKMNKHKYDIEISYFSPKYIACIFTLRLFLLHLLSFLSFETVCELLSDGFGNVLDGVEGLIEDFVSVQSIGLDTKVHLSFRGMRNTVSCELDVSVAVQYDS